MGPLMLDLAGHELSEEEKDILDHPLVGGVMLTKCNLYNLEQLRELVTQTRAYARNRLLIGIEQEGGTGQVLKAGLSPLPPLASLFRCAEGQLDNACYLAYQAGWLTAAELLALDAGCDMVLVCGNRDGAIAVLDALPSSYQASSRLNGLRKTGSPSLTALRAKALWQTANSAMESLHAG